MVVGFLLLLLIASGNKVWLELGKGDSVWSRQHSDLDSTCSCMWRISCPKFRWQVNFTSPRYKCGYEQLNSESINQCLERRHAMFRRRAVVHIAGHIREAFLFDYIRRRLTNLEQTANDCRLIKTGSEQKPASLISPEYYKLETNPGAKSCRMAFENKDITLEFKFIQTLNDDAFSYIDSWRARCENEGCENDLLIFSAGVGELLESTLMDSFDGVRRFQKQFKHVLPQLIDLVNQHHLEVVWKIHEPVTDELIPEGSMVRNDLLQEYNALVMEQTILTPVHVWTSHMIMKLHHIESCSLFNDTAMMNSDSWRCEEEWVAGDQCHSDFFDTIFNKICDRMIEMPENPCCSA